FGDEPEASYRPSSVMAPGGCSAPAPPGANEARVPAYLTQTIAHEELRFACPAQLTPSLAGYTGLWSASPPRLDPGRTAGPSLRGGRALNGPRLGSAGSRARPERGPRGPGSAAVGEQERHEGHRGEGQGGDPDECDHEASLVSPPRRLVPSHPQHSVPLPVYQKDIQLSERTARVTAAAGPRR